MSVNSVKAIVLTTFNAASLTTNFQAINAAGLDQACTVVNINNDSNVAITISYDGVNPHEYASAGETLVLSFYANSQPPNNTSKFAKGTVVYVKAAGAGMGTIALSGYYQGV